MRHGYDAQLFGQTFVYTSLAIAIATEAISAMVAVRVYRGHRPTLALLYAGLVLVRCVGWLTFNSIHYGPADPLHFGINFRPLSIGAIVHVFPIPSLTALFGGMWAASRRTPAKHLSSATDMLHFGGHLMGDSVKCAVCGKPIEPHESRLVDVANGTKVHVHMECKGKA